jgi:TolB-like protein/DNA-binding winged helix-turn-helix (wHTH) protein/Flp pilus assembly protein TadD
VNSGALVMQQANGSSESRLRFGVFEVDSRLGLLTRQGKRLPLQEQPFQVLLMLLEKPGALVTREELHQRLWPDTVVDFDHGLNKAINKVRDILGDSATNPRFIETVARRGYRFLAEVVAVDAGPAGDLAQPAAAATAVTGAAVFAKPLPPEPTGRTGHPWLVVSVATAMVLAAVLAWVLLRPATTPLGIQSLAVLPLENLSGDATQDYFADGMTDELITQLAQISALRVISRTSVITYKTNHKPLATIARELNVQAVVEGSVLSSAGHVRITAQLIRVPADEHLWAKSFEGELSDTLKLQAEVAREIATQVRAKLKPQEQVALQESRVINPAAHEAYLKGRYFWNKRTAEGLRNAIEYFNAAIAADPSYAAAYAGLADSYALAGDWEYNVLSPQDAWPQAYAAARKALALDENLGAAHASLALALDLYAWDWPGAESEYQRALALSPNNSTAHHWYGFHLLMTGRTQDGVAQLRKAESLDPLSLIISTDIADALCIAHRYEESIQQSNKALALDPNFALAHYTLGQALEQQNLHEEAIARFRRAIELAGSNAAFDSNLAHAYALAGRRSEALSILRELEGRQERYPAAYANIALVYIGLGDHDAAIGWLEKAYKARANPSILLRPGFDPLRTDPRFGTILKRMNLPVT